MNRRQQYPIHKLEGPDVSLEISLKEYGMAWIENNRDVLFYYGTKLEGQDPTFTRFDFVAIDKTVDLRDEYDWADFEAVEAFIGQSIEDIPFIDGIQALTAYYGFENVFGSSYWEGLTYQQIRMNW